MKKQYFMNLQMRLPNIEVKFKTDIFSPWGKATPILDKMTKMLKEDKDFDYKIDEYDSGCNFIDVEKTINQILWRRYIQINHGGRVNFHSSDYLFGEKERKDIINNVPLETREIGVYGKCYFVYSQKKYLEIILEYVETMVSLKRGNNL